MTIDTNLPSWVSEFEEEYKTFRLKNFILSMIGLVLTGIFFFLAIIVKVQNNYLLNLLNFAFLIVGMILFAIYHNKKFSSISKYLASMIYSIGLNLEKNSDPESKVYIKNMENYLKNCSNIIDDAYSSIYGALYVNSTKDYLKKLEQAMGLLNEYYKNYPKYEINKSEIAEKVTKLACLIHNDKEHITPEHFTLLTSLADHLMSQNINEKPLNSSKIEKIYSTSKSFIIGLPYTLKLIIYIGFVFLVMYELINYVASIKGITQDIAFGYAIAGGIGALVPALMIKEHILK